MRKNTLEDQKKELKATLEKITSCHNELAELVTKTDLDFLRSCSAIHRRASTLALTEDSGLHSLSAQAEVPVKIDDCTGTLQNLGTVGGGPTPTNLTVVPPAGSHCNLLKLQWGVPQGSDDLEEFQIDCQNRTTSVTCASVTCSSVTCSSVTPSKLQSVSGNALSCFVESFVPGYSYQFRIRSRNKVCWGLWSPPTPDACSNFPIKVGFTKKIHRLVLPEDGFYRITAKGAKGGSAGKRRGGQGAEVSATFKLMAGDTLIILSGGKSQEQNQGGTSGGGGGSFVARNEEKQVLVVAGGGGGAQDSGGGVEWDGCDASLETAGTPGRGCKGGRDGGPGEDVYSSGVWAYGGAGAFLNSQTARSFLYGGEGGQCGGFGGGGAASHSGGFPGGGGGGGGGGYSGGGGCGGGGGSYVHADGIDVEKRIGHNDNGSVIIQRCSDVDCRPICALRQESNASSGSNSSSNKAY